MRPEPQLFVRSLWDKQDTEFTKINKTKNLTQMSFKCSFECILKWNLGSVPMVTEKQGRVLMTR